MKEEKPFPNRKFSSAAFLLLVAISLVYFFIRYWNGPTAEERLLSSRIFLFLLVAIAGAAAWLGRAALTRSIPRFLFRPESPVNLAMARTVVCLSAFFSVDIAEVRGFSSLSPGMILLPTSFHPLQVPVSPAGLGWLAPLLPRLAPYTPLAAGALQVFAVSGVLGFFSRTSVLFATLLGFWVFGVPNFYGKVFTDHQILLWFGIILAASRCGDAFSVDRALRKLRAKDHSIPVDSAEYGLPVKSMWLVFGLIYFFPGFWKLYYTGFDWVFGDHLKLRMYRQWLYYGHGSLPFFRLDHFPRLLALFAAVVLIFELTFIFAIFFRRARNAYAIGGAIFHGANAVFILYHFYPLRACYSLFVNWAAVFHRSSLPTTAPPKADSRLRPKRTSLFACAFVVVCTFIFGALNLISWPFSAYPHFATRFESTVLVPQLVALDAQGGEVDVQPALRRLIGILHPVRWINRVELRLLGPDNETMARELTAVWDELRKIDPTLARVSRLRLFQERVSTVPEERGLNPLSRTLRYEMEVGPGHDK